MLFLLSFSYDGQVKEKEASWMKNQLLERAVFALSLWLAGNRILSFTTDRKTWFWELWKGADRMKLIQVAGLKSYVRHWLCTVKAGQTHCHSHLREGIVFSFKSAGNGNFPEIWKLSPTEILCKIPMCSIWVFCKVTWLQTSASNKWSAPSYEDFSVTSS